MNGDMREPVTRNEAELDALPTSERIRYRLVGAGCRYHANDNIADYIGRRAGRAAGRGPGSMQGCSRRW
jgi:hypothetical protein